MNRLWTQRKILIGLLGVVGTVSGCHRATKQDCEQILDRIVELELKEQGIEDPGQIREKKQQIRAAKEKDLIASCVGRRVSRSALTCIKKATSSKEITERCLR